MHHLDVRTALFRLFTTRIPLSVKDYRDADGLLYYLSVSGDVLDIRTFIECKQYDDDTHEVTVAIRTDESPHIRRAKMTLHRQRNPRAYQSLLMDMHLALRTGNVTIPPGMSLTFFQFDNDRASMEYKERM